MPDNSNKFSVSNDSVGIPDWVNAAYFKRVLKRELREFRRILNLAIIPATPPGESYTSLLMRVVIDIELKDGFSQQRSYIVKTMLNDVHGNGGFVNTLNIFPKEKMMYDTIIPQLEELYEKMGLSVKFAPKCVWSEDLKGRICLVQEDLRTKKYKNISRLKGFDMEQMERVLEKLAEFHAASAVWRQKHGPFPEDFQRIYLPANYNKSKSYQARVQSYKAAMASWGLADHEQYVNRIPTADQFVQSYARCFNNNPQEFKVLNHGDFWSSNIMLSYTQSGEINQLRFVDFQLCKWGSPAQDLWELIICSAKHSIRIECFDSFIRIYHTHLVRCLKTLNFSERLPLLRDLHMSMIKYGFWGYFTTFTHLVFILLPVDTEASLVKLTQPGEEGDRFRAKVYTNPLYVRAVLSILPFLYRRGILDF
ncbi:uncharacterized protein Dana_GF17427 [Drosophila ananassae]|uniref:CHK kinase-like domain-containing protein n=1 Tax=Drosophila ananassae TaxID=7217 RepID=B3LWL1_DROAN|nr:uncharacterized protein LOC6500211 [Drosophila ananassae]EDV41605.2 uncharacterized protein Dana_GF17427 [Drosophila ananassae]